MKPIDFLEQAVQPTTTPATPDQQAKLKAAQQQQAMGQARAVQASHKLNLQQLKQLLPNIDVSKLTAAIKANASGRMNNIHLMSMGVAFQDLLKSDPNNIIKLMNLLKKAQAMPPVQNQPVKESITGALKDMWSDSKSAYGHLKNAWNYARGDQYQTKIANKEIADQLFSNYVKAKDIISKKYRSLGTDPQDLQKNLIRELNSFLLRSLKIRPQYDITHAEQIIASNPKTKSFTVLANKFISLVNGGLIKPIKADILGNNAYIRRAILDLVTSSNLVKTVSADKEDYFDPTRPEPQASTMVNGQKIDLLEYPPATLGYSYRGQKYLQYVQNKQGQWVEKSSQNPVPDPFQELFRTAMNKLIQTPGK
jgi:hypothetical protein